MVSQSTSQNAIFNQMLVEIRDSTDRALRLIEYDDGSTALSVDATESHQFILTMMDPDLFMLQTADGQEFLSVGEDGRLVLSERVDDAQKTFQLVRSTDTDTHFGFRTIANGRFLGFAENTERVSAASAESLEDAARFTFAPVLPAGAEAPVGHTACCCGPGHSHSVAHDHGASPDGDKAEAMWNDYTHFRIVEMAVHYLRHMENPTAEARFISDIWDRGSKKIAEGLKGADYWPEWMPDDPLWAIYYYHFYNPDTGASFPWPSSWYKHNAVSRGAETFDNSVQFYRDGPQLHDRAFIHLGLSLHYLTDLCQPMHAANFINNPLTWDWRHSGYEKYAEDFVQNRNFFRQPGGYPPIRRDEIENTSPSARGWLIGVAQQSLATWKEVLGPATEKKVRWVPGPHGPIMVYDNEWTAAEADPSLMRSLWLAPRNTARYLCMWASRVRQ
jgi:hypothetical protein